MTGRNAARRFTKRYPNAESCRHAASNYRWLASLGTPLRLPRLLGTRPRHLDFEFVDGRPAEPADLAALAAHLGDAHGAAFTTTLQRAHLDEPFITQDGHLIPDFLSRRSDTVRQLLDQRRVPSPQFGPEQATAILRDAARGPTAIYKDCNPRNFLISSTGVVTIDFDQVGLAPFGYDLAKLVVTLAMTHGVFPRESIYDALKAYNAAVHRHHPMLGVITMPELREWAEIHHILTSGYLGRHGYRHGWHILRKSLVEPGEE